jgi:hypothetical protein
MAPTNDSAEEFVSFESMEIDTAPGLSAASP